MLGKTIGAAALLAVMQQTPAASGPVLLPSGKWEVGYVENGCTAVRVFGAGEAKLTFALKRQGGFNRGAEVILVSSGEGEASAPAEPEVRLLPAGNAFEVQPAFGAAPDENTYVVRFGVSAEQLMTMAQAMRVDLPLQGENRATIEPRGLPEVLKALTGCQTESLITNGAIKAELEAVAVPPEPVDPARWISHTDYPIEAVRQGLSGTVTLLWRISAEGEIDQCRVVHNSGAAVLARGLCSRLERRVRYRPARDSAGNAVPAWDLQRIKWSVP